MTGSEARVEVRLPLLPLQSGLLFELSDAPGDASCDTSCDTSRDESRDGCCDASCDASSGGENRENATNSSVSSYPYKTRPDQTKPDQTEEEIYPTIREDARAGGGKEKRRE